MFDPLIRHDSPQIVFYILLHPPGVYLGYTKHKYRKWVELTKEELKDIEGSASDPADLAKRLFVVLFKDDLDTRAESICCTESRELLDQEILAGIRCKLKENVYYNASHVCPSSVCSMLCHSFHFTNYCRLLSLNLLVTQSCM